MVPKMAVILTGLISGNALKPVYATKSKPVDEKTVSATGKAALDLKISGEEADGWRVVRSNKSSVRLAKEKPVDRQLEDDVWSLRAQFRPEFRNPSGGRYACTPARRVREG
jgi:hypothetical protein